ncbi:serine hydrolase domain-containing protein [Plantactinospora soyae]|uniref:CubicO group peptidase (Beta-lactamase class C family) n=1 Tax=Plantactinospora soyae TaxID=1544732 RepID=A0A927MBA6_9ACTN|nr:serine hydrolase domain-containing protein [Plantactinospora soyae]MBE1490430.1 CubicO group peptidase (beta-lactamase class C family) [Plantactinospora soyae]
MGQDRIWWRGVVAAATVGLVALAVPGPAFAKEGPDLAAVERLVTDFADQGGYPGIAIAITKGDQVVHVGGYGHDSSGAAVTATTPLPAASLSKSFTALAVMQLVEAGKMALDAPVRGYLPDFRIADPRGARITVRQLLNQTSGITDGTLPEKSLPQPDSLAAAVVRARDATLAADPGTRYSYTNTNYHLAARLVEVVAGEPFAQYLRRHVLDPAGMQASATIDLTPRDLPQDVREGHIYAYGASIPLAEPKRFVNGSDGVITTAEDMAQWLIVQNNAGKSANGVPLVSAESIAAMHTSSDPRWTYGMGWDIDQEGRVRHNGVWFTYTASQLLLPSGYGIAVIGNSGIGLGNEGTDQLADGLATLVAGGKPSSGAPIRLIVDLVVAGLTLLSLLLGLRNLRRTQAWATRLVTRPAWRLVLRLLPRLVPLALLVMLPDLLSQVVAAGRDITFVQLGYYSVALVTWTTVAAAMNLGVLGTRTVALVRLRRSTGTTPVPEASAQLAAR